MEKHYDCSGFTEVAWPTKYFIPSIEDIHIGYEAEFHWATSTAIGFNDDGPTILSPAIELWEPIVCGYIEHIFDGNKYTPEEFHNLIKLGSLRTLYLTPIQIEKEGWNSWRGAGDITTI